MKPIKRFALIYRQEATWVCETQGHAPGHPGDDTKTFPTRKAAEGYAKSIGCTPRRATGCDAG